MLMEAGAIRLLPMTTTTDTPAADVSDEELARRAQKGDPEAFSTLVERYQRGIVNLAYRLVGDWETALDLAQDTFVRAYQALDTFDPTRRFSSWLYRIATNRCYDYLRQQGRWESVVVAEPAEGVTWPGDTSDDPLRHLEQHDLRMAIEEAIAALPPRYRAVVVLRYLENLSYQEIADVLDLPIGTVKTHLYRARDLLRKILNQKGMVP